MTTTSQPSKLMHYEHYDSLAEIGEEAERRANKSAYSGDTSWAGATLEEAWTLAREGWDAPLEQMDTSLADQATSLQFAPVLDVAGDVVDMGLYLQGQPECMLSYPLQERKVASITLLVPIAFSSFTNKDTATNRAIAVASAIESFRERGISVTVIAYFVAHGKRGKVQAVTVTLADSRYAYDPARVAFGCGHPAMLRCILFNIQDGFPDDVRSNFNIPGGRGHAPYNLTETDDEVRNYIMNRLDTQVSVDLPALGYEHNGWDLQQHVDQVMTIMGGAKESQPED